MMDDREKGRQLLREMLPVSAWDGNVPDDMFAGDLSDLALTNVYGRIWGRDGLDRRSRSLVTLGILIALRAAGQLKLHFSMAVENGLTKEELEEVIYQATAYAGFPAAVDAASIAAEVFSQLN